MSELEISQEEQTPARPNGRPDRDNKQRSQERLAAEERYERAATRRREGTFNGFARDQFALKNKDPRFEYYWPLDSSESGARIQDMQEQGWELVNAKRDKVEVSNQALFESPAHGSIYRVHNRDGRHHYLMRINKEWRASDKHENEKKLQELEEQIFGSRGNPMHGPQASYTNKTRYE